MMAAAWKTANIIALCSAVFLAPTPAASQDAGDKAIESRQGYMRLIVWEAGPLFGMAKGNVAYDADAAAARAANLRALSQYALPDLFLPGTSRDDRPGKTCALPEIWQDTAKLETAYTDFADAIAALGEVARDGQPALAAAVSELGKSCGVCHKPFRAKDSSQPFGFCLPEG